MLWPCLQVERAELEFLEVLTDAATASQQCLLPMSEQLAAAAWNPSVAVLRATEDGHPHRVRGFLRLSDSFADLLARGTCGGCGGDAGSAVCGLCKVSVPTTDLFALTCRHFHCVRCWEHQVEQSLRAPQEGAPVTCMTCPAPLPDDLVATVCEERLWNEYSARRLR